MKQIVKNIPIIKKIYVSSYEKKMIIIYAIRPNNYINI